MSDRGAELDAALQNATDAPAILAALGAAIAHNEDRAARAPTLADLGAAVLPFDAVQEAVARSSAAVGTPALQLMAAPLGGTAAAAPPMPGNLALYWIWLPVSTARPDLASDDTCEAIHRAWLAAAEPRPLHPLAPLVDAWQRRPSLETWTERQYRNVPAPLAATDHVVPAQDDRPGADHLPFDWDALHAAPPDQPRFEVAYLPTLDPDADSLLPLAMLDLFTSAASRGYGGPVPVPARIGWEVVLALDAAARRGGPAQLNCTLADLHQMVYPATPRWQKRHGPDLVRGLFNLDVARVRWRGDATGGLYPLVEVYRLPSQTRPSGAGGVLVAPAARQPTRPAG